VLTISNTIRRTQTPDGAVLLDVERGQMFSLNLVGSKILELVDLGADETQIVEQVSALFGAEIELVRRDVRGFLKALNAHEILQSSPSATAIAREQDIDHTEAT
jgi:Coenzyme PQQ synthesis protein D (PqqD)